MARPSAWQHAADASNLYEGMWKTRGLDLGHKADMAGQRGPRNDWPRLAEVRGSPEHDLALKEASGEPANREV